MPAKAIQLGNPKVCTQEFRERQIMHELVLNICTSVWCLYQCDFASSLLYCIIPFLLYLVKENNMPQIILNLSVIHDLRCSLFCLDHPTVYDAWALIYNAYSSTFYWNCMSPRPVSFKHLGITEKGSTVTKNTPPPSEQDSRVIFEASYTHSARKRSSLKINIVFCDTHSLVPTASALRFLTTVNTQHSLHWYWWLKALQQLKGNHAPLSW